jgi:hypothetical protein
MTDTNTNRVRHAVSRSTGATTWTRKDGDEWKTTCLNHGSETTTSSRAAGWKNGSTPANFCAKCKAIAAGKTDRITGDRLELPATTPTPKVAVKRAAPKPKPAEAAKAAATK